MNFIYIFGTKFLLLQIMIKKHEHPSAAHYKEIIRDCHTFVLRPLKKIREILPEKESPIPNVVGLASKNMSPLGITKQINY